MLSATCHMLSQYAEMNKHKGIWGSVGFFNAGKGIYKGATGIR